MTVQSHTLDAATAAARPLLPFYLGAGIDAVLAFDLIAFPGTIARLLVADAATAASVAAVLPWLGAALLLVAADTMLLVRARPAWQRLLGAVAALNALAAAAAVVVLLLGAWVLSGFGLAALIAIAAASVGLAAWQVRAVRRLPRG